MLVTNLTSGGGQRASYDHRRLLGLVSRLQRMADQSLARAEDFTREMVGAQWIDAIAELLGGGLDDLGVEPRISRGARAHFD